MECEWAEITARRRKTLVAGWREDMAAMRREQEGLVASGLWITGPTDFLGIVGLARHENTHSRMLKWLLTPTARHGVGGGLLERVVQHCTGKPVTGPLPVRRVAFSVWKNNREADVVVWGRDFTLVIENKVDAPEQPHQCDDLYENFGNEREALFLFLTPGGQKPSTATTSCARRAFSTLSWPDLRAMLEEAMGASRSATRAAGARDVVRNYLQTLEEQFG